MRKLIGLLVFSMIFVLAACGGNSSNNKDISVDDVIKAFKDGGAEVGSTDELDNSEFGDSRIDGKRILVPSLGEDSGGRLLQFEKEKDLEAAESYYVELGKSSPLFYSHTHKKGMFLLQMNGDMEDDEFKKYEKAMDDIIK